MESLDASDEEAINKFLDSFAEHELPLKADLVYASETLEDFRNAVKGYFSGEIEVDAQDRLKIVNARPVEGMDPKTLWVLDFGHRRAVLIKETLDG